LLIANAVAQEQRFINFSVKDGMPEKYIYNAAQDAQGFMWFGTGTGLYRYDGHQFKTFRSPLDKPGRNIANILQTIAIDSSNNLWLGSVNTLQWYHPATNTFWEPDYNNPTVKALCDAYINSFSLLPGGNMFIGSSKDYFFSFTSADSSFTHWRKFYPPSASKTCLKVVVAGNDVWAVHMEGIYHFNINCRFQGFYPSPTGDITTAQYDRIHGNIVFTTWDNGVGRFYPENKTFKAAEFQKKGWNESLFSVLPLPNGKIWVGGYSLFVLDSADKPLVKYNEKKDNIYNLGVMKIGCLYSDREGNLWICSHFGLSMMPWQNNQFKIRTLVDKISGNTVEPVTNMVFVKGTDELLIANTSTAGLMHYTMASDSLTTLANPLEKGSVDRARIIYLVEGADGSVYAGDDVHFYRYLTGSRQLLPFPLYDQHGKAITGVIRSVFDNKGNVYMACRNNGFYIWHQPSNKLTHYNLWDIDKTANREDGNICYPTLVDRDNNVWMVGNSGVYQYRQSDGRYYHHAWQPADKTMPVPVASSIAQDKAGHYWIASKSNGLYELYFENGKEVLRNYTQYSNTGLPTDYLYQVRATRHDSCLWVNGHVGLMRFDPQAKKILTVFNQQQGLAQNDGGYYFDILPDGRLVHLYYGFLNMMDLKGYRFNQRAPAIVLSSVQVLTNEYVYQLESNRMALQLAHNENFVRIEFTALSFNNSNLNQYAYQLIGVDRDWVYGSSNYVSYAGLKPGRYTFRVKAANNDGLWGSEQVLSITIRPPVYATWWFITLSILLLAGLIYWWNRSRIAQVKKEEKLKSDFRQQIAETEMKALRAQMNPHFIFNCLNSIQKYILQQDHFAASQYLTRFSRLIRLILDHSNQNTIQLSGELELLKLYVEMEQLRFDNRFDFVIKIADDIAPELVAIPSMLIQPYLENSIWHGLLHKVEKGLLLLSFSRSAENSLRVVVEDNGVGRAMAAELKSKQVLKKKSYGMQITENRIAIINRTQNINATCEVTDLFDTAGRASGTRVVLMIPLQLLTKTATNDQGSIDR
jgi:ligand-binding sensor domain-containing protein